MIFGWRTFGIIAGTLLLLFASEWVGRPVGEVTAGVIGTVLGFYFGQSALKSVGKSVSEAVAKRAENGK